MDARHMVAMALQEAGFSFEISNHALLPAQGIHSPFVRFWRPGDRNKGKFMITDDVFVSCHKKDTIKIDLHDPTSLQKIIMMANKCVIRQSVGHFDSCGHCPFKKKDNTSAIASFKRHTRNRDDLY
jgi:hypothetical protein